MKIFINYVLLLSLFLFIPVRVAFADTLDVCPPGSTSITCQSANINFSQALGGIINFVFVVAVILALGFLIYGGIRWITSGGDKGAVATARGTIIAAIIGLIVVVLAYVVINLVLKFLTGGDIGGITIPTITGARVKDTRPWCGMNQQVTDSCYCFASRTENGTLICKSADIPIDSR